MRRRQAVLPERFRKAVVSPTSGRSHCLEDSREPGTFFRAEVRSVDYIRDCGRWAMSQAREQNPGLVYEPLPTKTGGRGGQRGVLRSRRTGASAAPDAHARAATRPNRTLLLCPLGGRSRASWAPKDAPESGVPPPHRPCGPAVGLSVRLGRVWRAHRSALWMRGQGCSRRLAGLLECCAQRCNAGGAWILFCTTRPHKAAVRESSSLSPPARVAGASVNFTLH